MSRLLYLSVWDFTDEEKNGICKKIKSQEKVFTDAGFQVDCAYISRGQACVRIDGSEILLGEVGILGKLKANHFFYDFLRKNIGRKPYDAVYIRYGLSDRYFYKTCKLLKQAGARIIIEIPTYPYEGEANRGWKDTIGIFLDHTYRRKLSLWVDQIATFTDDPSIWNIPAYHIQNGIDTAAMSARSGIHGFGTLNLVAVANVGPWHGYDRLIDAMGRYYKAGGKENCVFHLAGGGAELDRYKELVMKWDLWEHVIFHGSLYGKALDDLYDDMDLAVETLGMHRKGIVLSSSLKSKEYAFKGLPIITSCKLDAFPEDACEFVLMLPSGEQEIDLNSILRFYKELYFDETTGSWSLEKKEKLTAFISDYAKAHCDMHRTMQETVQRLKGINSKEI